MGDGTGRTATDEQRRVRDDSDRLLAAIDSLKALEQRKRFEDMSTPPFHELSDQVESAARSVFEIAVTENHDGDQVETTDISAAEVDPRDR